MKNLFIVLLIAALYSCSSTNSLGTAWIVSSGNFKLKNDTTAVSRWGKVYVKTGKKTWTYKYTCEEYKW